MPRSISSSSPLERTTAWVDAIPLRRLDQAGTSRSSFSQASLRSARPQAPEEVSLPGSGAAASGGSGASLIALAPEESPSPASWASGTSTLQAELFALPDSRSETEESAFDQDQDQNIVSGQTPGNPHREAPSQIDGTSSLQQLENATADPSFENRTSIPNLARPETDANSFQQPDYWTRVAPLIDCIPQLKSLRSAERSRWSSIGKILCVDDTGGEMGYRVFGKWSVSRDESKKAKWNPEIKRLKTDIPDDVGTRIIIVEDLSDTLLEALGTAFNVNPEVFARHLTGAAVHGSDHEDSLPTPVAASETWKGPVSLDWLRPVKQHPQLSEWLQEPQALLDEVVGSTSNQAGSKANSARPGISWSEQPRQAKHHATVDNNIWRRSWSLFAARNIPHTDHLPNDASILQWSPDTIPTVWKERATFYACSLGSVHIALILLDPLPSITVKTKCLDEHPDFLGITRARYEKTNVKCFSPSYPRTPTRLPQNILEATPEDIARFHASTREVVPTSEAIQTWMFGNDDDQWDMGFSAQPSISLPVALLEVVRMDTVAAARMLEAALQRISKDSLDDYLIQRRLADWRRLMSDFQTELPIMRYSLHNSVGFFFGGPDSPIPDAIQDMISEIDGLLLALKGKIDETYAALRVDMQFSESRRSINEAKTVTKLTELAFLFIPLSFVSSVFSMSVKELQDGVSIWIFVVTAIGFATLAYGLRIAVANDFFADKSRRMLERLWIRQDVRRNTKIASTTFLKLTLKDIWERGGKGFLLKASWIVFIFTVVGVPVGFLWVTSELDLGLKLSLSLLLLLISALGAFFFPFTMADLRRYHGYLQMQRLLGGMVRFEDLNPEGSVEDV